MTNSPKPRKLSFSFNQVPGLQSRASTAFSLYDYDIWARKTLTLTQYGGYTADAVPPHGSVFLKIFDGSP